MWKLSILFSDSYEGYLGHDGHLTAGLLIWLELQLIVVGLKKINKK